MAKTNLATVPLGTYAAGTYSLSATNVGKTTSSVEVAIDRSAFDSSTAGVQVATLQMDGSSDNGATWISLGGGSVLGGVVVGRDGVTPLAESIYNFTFPDGPKTNAYRVRGSITLLQQITTGARLTAI